MFNRITQQQYWNEPKINDAPHKHLPMCYSNFSKPTKFDTHWPRTQDVRITLHIITEFHTFWNKHKSSGKGMRWGSVSQMSMFSRPWNQSNQSSSTSLPQCTANYLRGHLSNGGVLEKEKNADVQWTPVVLKCIRSAGLVAFSSLTKGRPYGLVSDTLNAGRSLDLLLSALTFQ